jgi:hypothetical protein
MGEGAMEVLWAIALQAGSPYRYLWVTIGAYGGWSYGGTMGHSTSG